MSRCRAGCLWMCTFMTLLFAVVWFWPSIEGEIGTLHTGQQLGVLGFPSLSVSFVNQVLAACGSPAYGKGQALYDDSLIYGIDDAYALAFFKHESSCGTQGWGASNHSLGNIRCSAGYACGGGYRSYASWEAGFADWYALISQVYVKQWHLMTVEQIIPKYAPAADNNDEQAYIDAVNTSVARWRAGQV